MVPPNDNFLSAKFEAEVPTEAVLGCFFKDRLFAAVTATWCMYLLTMNGFLRENSIATEFHFSSFSSVDYIHMYVCVCVCVYVSMYVY